MASSRQGLREDLRCKPAFRRGLGLGVGFKVQAKVNQNRSTRYVIGFTACEGLACEPWPPPQHHPIQRPKPVSAFAPPPTRSRPYHGGGGLERQTPIYLYIYICILLYIVTYIHTYICMFTQIEIERQAQADGQTDRPTDRQTGR